MKITTILTAILQQMPSTARPFLKFFLHLLPLHLELSGRYNYTNMSRWSPYHERTFRRYGSKGFDFLLFNTLFARTYLKDTYYVAGIDCTYIAKSGKQSYGVGQFWSGSEQKVRWGQEISTLTLIGTTQQEAFTLSAQQTPPITREANRITFYLEQIAHCKEALLSKTRHLAADGFYAKQSFINGVEAMGFHLITKLRKNAALYYYHQGPHPKKRGRKRKYAGKVKWDSSLREHFTPAGTLEKGVEIRSQLLYSKHLKRQLLVVVLLEGTKVLSILATTDIELSPKDVVAYYSLRFQMEYTYRDAKQHLGLMQCQSRKKEAFAFQFNLAFTLLNLAKIENQHTGKGVFSMADIKIKYRNEYIVNQLIKHFDLNPEHILNHPNYQSFINLGRMAA